MLCGTLAGQRHAAARRQHGVVREAPSIGVLSAFMTYALSLFQTFRQQAARISQLISLQANVERVVDLIDESRPFRTARKSKRNTATAFAS